MNRAELLALAARVEAATGADRELDKAIYREACPFAVPNKLGRDGFHWNHPPIYSASLDAAMTLVPSGKWSITSCGDRGDWQAWAWTPDGHPNWHTAPTPARALTAAAIRALAERMTDGD